MKMIPIRFRETEEYGLCQWEQSKFGIQITACCPLLMDDIYRVYLRDNNGCERLLGVLEPKGNEMICKRQFSGALPWIDACQAEIRGRKPAPPALKAEGPQLLDPLLDRACREEATVHRTHEALFCPFRSDRPVPLLFAASIGLLKQNEKGYVLQIMIPQNFTFPSSSA